MSNKIPAGGGRLAVLYGLNRWRSYSRWLLLAGALLFVIVCWAVVYEIAEMILAL